MTRNIIETKLEETFGKRLIPVEKAGSIINRFKGENFAMSQMGMMLYCNGYSLRGTSHRYPNGLIYYDGHNAFGVGYFAKEGERKGHIMLVAPQGPERFRAVQDFIEKVRGFGISHSSVYIRHLAEADYTRFLELGMQSIETDPWHPDAPTEDEHYYHRLFFLDDWFGFDETSSRPHIRYLPYSDSRGYRRKPRLAYNRFQNFLRRNSFVFHLVPYEYSDEEKRIALAIVKNYFAARRRRKGTIGSTSEDYLALVNQKPSGEHGTDYFPYLGYLQHKDHPQKRYPAAFFLGVKLGGNRAGLYAAISSRFEEDFKKLPLYNTRGYTAFPQFVYLMVFGELYQTGIRVVDIGGSETASLDHQKKQLGGRPNKTYWVVAP